METYMRVMLDMYNGYENKKTSHEKKQKDKGRRKKENVRSEQLIIMVTAVARCECDDFDVVVDGRWNRSRPFLAFR